MTQRKVEYWVLPPQADAEFVAHMEQVLDCCRSRETAVFWTGIDRWI